MLVAATSAALGGCQLVLGFEDHELFPTDGGGGGAPTGGGPAGGGDTGGGAPTGFGDPEEVASGLGSLEAVAMSGSDVYVLGQEPVGYRILRSRNGATEVLVSQLVAARGLAAAGDEVITTHGPLDGSDEKCHVSAFAGEDRRDLMTDAADAGGNGFFAVAVFGDTVAASFLDLQGNSHSDVRIAPLAGGATTLIGLGEDDSAAVPSIAAGNGLFLWVDSQLDDVMSSTGVEVQGINNPPGDSVNTLAEGLTTLYEVVVESGVVYVARSGQIASISVSGEANELSAANAPRGLAADSSIVVWADATEVRAYLVETGEVVTLDQPDDEPTDVALSASSVVYVTAGGRIVQIPRN